jgi:nicotinate-nucleotide pyrophosphorylase (carboxylating)
MSKHIQSILKKALKEDAPNGDITVQSLFPNTEPASAKIIAKQEGIFFGEPLIQTAFHLVDPEAKINCYKKDGDTLRIKDTICDIRSNHAAILLVERSLLNLMQHLSGVATQTKKYVDALNNPSIHILDTRKTTVGLRALEKQAILSGGGHNHRMGLSDMILIKENHLRILSKQQNSHLLHAKLQAAKKQNPHIKIEIEIESYTQLNDLNLQDADYILLDNFSLDDLPKATQFIRQTYPHAKIECSGNITLTNIHKYAHYDIDRLSIGALTHSVPAFDFSLLMTV